MAVRRAPATPSSDTCHDRTALECGIAKPSIYGRGGGAACYRSCGSDRVAS